MVLILLVPLLGRLLTLDARNRRSRWGRLAILATPAVLITPFVAASGVNGAGAPSQGAGQAAATGTSPSLMILNLIGIALLVTIAFLVAKLARTPEVRERWTPLLKAALAKLPGKSQDEQGTSLSDDLYCETALRLGVLISKCDNAKAPAELHVLKRIFNLRDSAFAQAEDIYDNQLVAPKDVEAIVAPYLAQGDAKPEIGEALLLGMAHVAMLNSHMSTQERALIGDLANAFDIDLGATRRILLRAGSFDPSTDASEEPSESAPVAITEMRGEYLQTLGLSADASEPAIRKAWRTLVSKYHPDKLMAQNPPAAELEQAQNRIRSINHAYTWLKDNG